MKPTRVWSRVDIRLTTIAAFTALASACQAAPQHPEGSSKGQMPVTRHVTMAASWAVWYRSISELKQHSDFAIRASVVDVSAAVKPDDGPVYSMVSVKPSQTIWQRSTGIVVPDLVAFQQTGGTYDGVTFEIEDDPLYHVGDDVVLFFVQYEPGKFRVSGGPTGRFEVVDQGREVRTTVFDGVRVPAGTSIDALARL